MIAAAFTMSDVSLQASTGLDRLPDEPMHMREDYIHRNNPIKTKSKFIYNSTIKPNRVGGRDESFDNGDFEEDDQGNRVLLPSNFHEILPFVRLSTSSLTTSVTHRKRKYRSARPPALPSFRRG